mgnify:CR=1 FL=1
MANLILKTIRNTELFEDLGKAKTSRMLEKYNTTYNRFESGFNSKKR